MKRFIAAMLVCMLAFACLPAAVFAEDFSVVVLNEAEILETAKLVELDFDGLTVFSYQPSELYYCNTSVMPIFYYYAGETLTWENAAQKLEASGLLALAEKEKAGVFMFSPGENGYDAERDYQLFVTMSAVMQDNDKLAACAMTYQKLEPRRWYLFAEGAGADFAAQVLLGDNAASGSISGMLLAGANAVTEHPCYAMPVYAVGCDEGVVEALKAMDGADSEETLASGETAYFNSGYVMDSGYTPKRVVAGGDAQAMSEEVTLEAWNALLQKVYRAPLENKFMSLTGESAAISEWAVPEELNLTYRVQYDTDGTLTPNVPNDDYNLWHEWIPNEALDADNTETFPLIVLMHGNTNNPIFTAEMNGWVTLAGEERVIVVGLQDIYQAGMPPCIAENRFGEENAAFIRDVLCEELPVDLSRIYISGFSIGAFVTADTAAADPGLFAAMAPLAYPADGYMQIFPYGIYDANDGEDRAAQYDIPMLYACGRTDGGNMMSDPNGVLEGKVSSAQLLINQALTFNEMTSMLIPLNDLAYEWYPGEHDVDGRGSDGAGYVVDGVEYATYASYACQALDFVQYPFLGYDPVEACGAVKTEFTTGEGVGVEKYVYMNSEGWPMVEQLVMGDMGHNHYGRYARIVWDDMFSHFSRNPQTGELIYDDGNAN